MDGYPQQSILKLFLVVADTEPWHPLFQTTKRCAVLCSRLFFQLHVWSIIIKICANHKMYMPCLCYNPVFSQDIPVPNQGFALDPFGASRESPELWCLLFPPFRNILDPLLYVCSKGEDRIVFGEELNTWDILGMIVKFPDVGRVNARMKLINNL